MTIASMTGFARVDGSVGSLTWHWEVRSVNGRGLDVRVRLPQGLDALEPAVRERVQRRLTRGSLTLALTTDRAGGARSIRLDEAVLRQVLEAAEAARRISGGAPATLDALLRIEGVLVAKEGGAEAEAVEARNAAVLGGLDEALGRLLSARAEEGARLAVQLLERLADIERLTAAVRTAPSRSPEAIAQRLTEQLARLLEQTSTLDPQRLHQEAALLATRADVTEELDRLAAHVVAARSLLTTGGAVGRRLDFLTQELNREANTVCSKSADIEVTRLGLELKAVVDQLREQVQNIE